MSDSVDTGATVNASGGNAPLRHLFVGVGVFLQFCGATLLIELFSRVGDQADCGARRAGACEEGSALLGLGAPVFVAGVLVFGLLDRRVGWSGPAMVFSGLSLIYGAAGTGLAFAWNAVTADSVLWAVLAGVIAVLPLGVTAVLLKGFFKGLREGGVRKWAEATFWVLEELPRSKRQRKRLARSRGIGSRRMRNGRLVPETRQEKFHWALFVIESCVALVGGVLAGWFFIVAVS
ncbi:hypothetical protein [Streptomyces lancefieldiae]|uniref:Uncharacterized protein n=1 Tax=Streptomyces lancefieldiae TaxID=3075520 RepID=A0ABU3AM00_9ACTN|nr:hypothetical protein [Streptomyces sp. DSM 40712]MDT0610108.1 hypothetical protein [Streptomyces sp. DSM 40712]